MSERVSNIYTKIQAVANDIKSIEKDLLIQEGGTTYMAVSDMSVVLKVKEMESKHGLISIPYSQNLVSSETLNTMAGGVNGAMAIRVDTIKMVTRVINIDNPDDFIEIESYGRGIDSSDKGLSKASTYARKSALLNLYKIATGSDVDRKTEPQAPQKPTRAKKLPAKKRGVKKPIAGLM